MAKIQALTDVEELKKLQQYFEEEALRRFEKIKKEIDEVLSPTLASWQDPVGQDFGNKYQGRVKNIQENMKNLINPLTTYLQTQAQELERNYLNMDIK